MQKQIHKAMIHYNPELHHDKLVKYIVESLLAKEELDQPLMPHQNNGNPVFALYDGEETYLFFSQEQHQELFEDAYLLYLKTIGTQEENQSIYNWDVKIAELNDKGDMGIVFSKGDMKVALTSEPNLSKENETESVYVAVVSNQEFYFDDEQASHLPTFRPVLGVYKDYYSAFYKVYETFVEPSSCSYEEISTQGMKYQYKYEDKEHGGYAIYTVEVCEEPVKE